MRAITKLLGGAAALAITVAAASSAQAAVYIGLSTDGGTTITTAADFILDPDQALFAGSFGSWNLNTVDGNFIADPELLNSGSLNATATSAGTLDVYVVRDNIAGAIPSLFLSSFTSNSLIGGLTLTTRTYVNAQNDTIVGGQVTNDLGTLLSTAMFAPLTPSAAQSVNLAALGPAGAGPYSVVERYTLVATGGGSSNATIGLQTAVPEPTTWALMILGFGSAGAMLRSRRRATPVAA